jgi:type VI secretion system protein ImpG
MLDLDKAGTPDPYVERLFEGFAFSMGRLREKIDDDLPELTEGLVSMLWPHYLRTIPSLSVVAFTPVLQAVKMAEVMPAGLEVYSRPVGPKNTVCRYRTTRDVMLNPLNISGVTMTTEPDGRSLLRMRFACSTQADWSHADLSHLSLYLGADAPVSSQLHLMLTRRQAALYMRLPGQTDRIRLDGYFSPGGFAEEDGLWPKGILPSAATSCCWSISPSATSLCLSTSTVWTGLRRLRGRVLRHRSRVQYAVAIRPAGHR